MSRTQYIPSAKKRRMDRDMALNLWQQGMCDAEIAEACGVTRDTVAEWRRGRGLQAHRKIRKKGLPVWLERTAADNARARAAGLTYGRHMAPAVIVRGHKR